MPYTHSQVITLTGKRQSGVTTSLLEHVAVSLKANPEKMALLLVHNKSMYTLTQQLVNQAMPKLQDRIQLRYTLTLDAVFNLLRKPPEGGFCGVFADDGYRYLSHEGLMQLAREYPLLDIVVGDSFDGNAVNKSSGFLAKSAGAFAEALDEMGDMDTRHTTTSAADIPPRGQTSHFLHIDEHPYFEARYNDDVEDGTDDDVDTPEWLSKDCLITTDISSNNVFMVKNLGCLVDSLAAYLRVRNGKVALVGAANLEKLKRLTAKIKSDCPMGDARDLRHRAGVILGQIVTKQVLINSLRNDGERKHATVFVDGCFDGMTTTDLIDVATAFPEVKFVINPHAEVVVSMEPAGSENDFMRFDSGVSDEPERAGGTNGPAPQYLAFKELLKTDSDYLWGWQCNLAMTIKDASNNSVMHRHANVAAAEFLNRTFDVDVTKFKEWEDFEKHWEVQAEASHYTLTAKRELSVVCTNGIVKSLGKVTTEFKDFVWGYLETLNDDDDLEYHVIQRSIPLTHFPILTHQWLKDRGQESIYEV